MNSVEISWDIAALRNLRRAGRVQEAANKSRDIMVSLNNARGRATQAYVDELKRIHAVMRAVKTETDALLILHRKNKQTEGDV